MLPAFVLAVSVQAGLAAGPQPAAGAQTAPTGALAEARLEGTFIALSVADAAVSARWYGEILGFRVFTRIDPPNAPTSC